MNGAMSPMKPLGKFAGLQFFWADRRWFTHPGLYVWFWKKNRRILPMTKRQEPQR